MLTSLLSTTGKIQRKWYRFFQRSSEFEALLDFISLDMLNVLYIDLEISMSMDRICDVCKERNILNYVATEKTADRRSRAKTPHIAAT